MMIKKLEGPKVAVVLSLIVAVWSLVLLFVGAFDKHSVNQMLTVTVRLSFLYFVIAFSVSSILYFHKSAVSLWLMRNRRYIGIAFGLAFVMHFLAIGLKAWLYPDPFVEGLHFNRVVRGGLMLGTVLLLTLTSSDFVVQRVRPWLWKLVHVAGSFYIFYRFWQNYYSFTEYDNIYYIPVALMLIAGTLKLAKSIMMQSESVKIYGTSSK